MQELRQVESLLRELSPYLRKRYGDREGMSISSKRHPNDLLTEVDVEMQERIIDSIAREFPDDAIVAEEEGFDAMPPDPRGRCWFIDPIDGTQNFVRGLFPTFGISVAFASEGRVQAGGVAFPLLDDFFLARQGGGATRNGKPLRVSTVNSLEGARVEIDLSSVGQRGQILTRFESLFKGAGQVRYHGAATVGLCAVASGDSEAYLHVKLNVWDYAAAALIVEEAGGQCSRLDGSPLTCIETPQSILASNGLLHEEFMSQVDR